ncbi:hypothetical protein [Paracoccus sp. SSJ]|uniref:hypothetical protein n=1 Tax=Paracoccus sp. SSJ TaxID=3050636 RepID=UPI00254A317B|nr:hypothetical protein [Paracoccus sp. SSJ]MDK8874226.1 hypothetical protein [Paracoccus sp. SSJ]
MTGGETPPGIAAAAALDDFADALGNAPRWLLETGGGGATTLRICAHRQGERLEILAELAGGPVQIVLEPHASGWLSIAAVCSGQEVFRAWLDRPYEEYEFWPEGAAIPAGRTIDPPGRIGKRRNWINLSAAAWPQLARFANAAGIVAAIEAEAQTMGRPDSP